MRKITGRLKRKNRVKRKLFKSNRPRMSVFRSLKHIYVQVIDDRRGVTLGQANSLDESLKDKRKELDKKGIAKEVGKLVAERCKSVGVKEVVFDRGGCRYMGRIAAVADGARDGGLVF
ncbi:MAG: 50S ribosomal protein L18 [Pseudomonadota bacterium]